jgi:diguanylate cyclase (GGDEF)-like protein
VGYDVVEAADGASAQALLEAGGIDAVVLDWELPDVNGPELLARWARDATLRWVPVLMITSHSEPERIRHALDLGAVDFLRKPAETIELDARLRAALRLRRLQLELLELAARDPLTGLLNRRAFQERLRTELERGSRYRRPLSVAMVDIDHFKRVNDDHGHDVGDEVLRQMAKLLLAGVRRVDAVARLGGEELVVLFPETPLAGAQLCMSRIREAGHATAFGPGAGGRPLRVTFSCGITDATAAGSDAALLMKLADDALYAAKRGGRDRIELAVDRTPFSAPPASKQQPTPVAQQPIEDAPVAALPR